MTVTDIYCLSSNFHTHCDFCDGTGSLVQFVESACQKGFSVIGFSSHAPLPFHTGFTMEQNRLLEYFETLNTLKRTFCCQGDRKIEIMAGLEIDYIHNLMGPADPKWHDSSLDLDYRIGAVHYPGLWPVSHIGYWLFGDPDEYACEGIENYFGGTPKNMVLHYYHLVSEMCDQGGFDIVAHLDFVKINNRDGKYFDEHSHWYRNAVFETLGIIAERDLLIEVNTGGKARGYRHDLYPSLEILRMAKMKGIRIVVNSDAHCPEMIDAYFPEALETLLEAGYKEKFVLHNKHWIPVPIK